MQIHENLRHAETKQQIDAYCHDAARIMPWNSDDGIEELAKSIKEDGQLDPVVLDSRGFILDGRNRWLACKMAGVEPKVRTASQEEEEYPVRAVLCRNLKRRHLGVKERAIVAARSSEAYREESEKRRNAFAPVGDNERGGRWSDEAAKDFGVSARTIERAAFVEREGDKSVSDACLAGDISVAKAEKMVKHLSKEEQRESIQNIKSSKSVEWYTPSNIIELARKAMGSIDLDPASCEEANKTVKAESVYTEAEDGLQCAWHDNVWLNPPYGKTKTQKWVAKLLEEFEAGRTKQAILLVNASTEAEWFQPLWGHVMCFPKGRIKFESPGGLGESPLHGSVLVYFGDDEGELRFYDTFKSIGAVVHSLGEPNE